MSDLRLKIKIDADGKASVAEIERVERELNKVRPAADRSGRAIDGMVGALTKLAPAISAAAIVGFSRELARAGDEMDALRLSAEKVSGSERGFDLLYSSAQSLGIALDDASQATNNFATPLSKLGRGYRETLQFSEDLNKSMRLYGVRGQAATSITTQLAQALNSGQLAGDELRSLTENAGPLAGLFEEAIHQITGSQASLKDLGAEGELTADIVVQAWDQVFEGLREDFASLPETLEQQENRMANAVGRLFAAMDDRLHSSDIWKLVQGELIKSMEAAALYLEGMSFERATAEAFGGLNSGDLPPELLRVLDTITKLREEARGLEQDIAEYGERGVVERLVGKDLPQLESELAAVRAELAQQNTIRDIHLDKLAAEREATQAAAEAERERAKAQKEGAEAASAATSDAIKLETQFQQSRAARVDYLQREAEQLGINIHLVEAIYKQESAFGKLASTGSSRWVQDMSQASGTLKEIVGSFQMGRDEINATGADVSTYAGEVEAFLAHVQTLADAGANSVREMAVAYHGGIGTLQRYQEKGDAWLAQYAPRTSAYADKVEEYWRRASGAAEDHGAAVRRSVGPAMTDAERAMAEAERQVSQLIRQYLPAEQAAREFAKAQVALALAGDQAGLSQEQQAEILANLERAMTEGTETAKRELDALGREVQSFGDLMLESAKTAVDSIQREMADGFGDLFADLLGTTREEMGVFERIVLDTVANLVAQLASQTIVVPIVANVMGISGQGTTTSAPGAAGSAGSISAVSNISSMFGGNSAGQGLMKGLQGLTNSVDVLSDTLGNSGWFQAGLSSIGKTSNLALLGGGAAGGIASNMLFDFDTQAETIGNTAGSAAGSVIGAAMAPILGPLAPLGPLLGSFLGGSGGGFLGGVFGGEEKSPRLTIGGADGDLSVMHARNVEAVEQYQAMVQAMNSSLDQLEVALGDAASAARDTVDDWATGQHLRPEQVEGWLQDIYQSISDRMLAAFEAAAVSDAEAAGGQAYASLVREALDATQGDVQAFVAAMQQINTVVTNVGGQLGIVLSDVEVGLAEAAGVTKSWLDQTGSLDGLEQAIAGYYENFFSEEERRAQAVAQAQETVNEAFEKIGGTIPQTREQFRDLVESLDLTTEGGAATFAALMGVNDAFALVTEQGAVAQSSIDDLFGALANNTDGLVGEVRSVLDDIVETGADAGPAFADMIREYVVGTLLNSLAEAIYASVVSPMVEAAASSASSMASGGTLSGTAVAQGGMIAAEELSAIVDQAVTALRVMDEIMSSAEWQAAMNDITAAVRPIQVAAPTYLPPPSVPAPTDTSRTDALLDREEELMRRKEEALNKQLSLEEQLLQLMGDTEELRRRELEALNPTAELLRGRTEALEEESKVTAAIEDERARIIASYSERTGKSLEETEKWLERTGKFDRMRIEQAEGTAAAIAESDLARLLEIDAIEKANVEMQERIWALQEEQAIAAERAGLERQLLSIQGDTAAIRAIELDALDESNRALQERIWALEKEQAIAAEREGLERQLLELQGDIEAIRQLELDALDESNRALQERIWALEKEQAIAAERESLEQQLLQLLGDTEELRRRELETINEANQALQLRIWAIEDEIAAIEEQYQAATEAAQATYDAQVDAINAQAEAQQEAYQEQIEAAQEYASEMSSVVSTLESALNQLGYVNDEVAAMEREKALQELSYYAETGKTPTAEEAEELAKAITASEGVYATAEEETAAEAVIRADLETVLSDAEKQLDAAEQTIEAIEQQTEYLQESTEQQLEQAQAAYEAELAAAEAWKEEELAKLDQIIINTDPDAGTPDGDVATAGDASDPAVSDPAATPRLLVQDDVQIETQTRLVEETQAMRSDMRTLADNQAYLQDLMLSILRKWDEDGLPPDRDLTGSTDDGEDDRIAYVLGYEAA